MVTDVYVLAAERSNQIFAAFFNTWLKNFIETAEEYEFPQYSETPYALYKSPWELVKMLVKNPKEPHAIYWCAPNGSAVRNGMAFFTLDGAMIVGLTIDSDDAQQISCYLQNLADSVRATTGYIAFEEPPPETVEDFVSAVRHAMPPKLVDGRII